MIGLSFSFGEGKQAPKATMWVKMNQRLFLSMKVRVACLLYHDVSDEPSKSGFNFGKAASYKLVSKQFVGQLDIIAAANLSPVLMYSLNSAKSAKEILCMLSFDDGGKSAITIADYLDVRGWKGHFFIPTSMIGKRGFVNRNDIIDLHNRGHVVGSHSHSHPLIFYELKKRDMRSEWRISLDILSSIVGNPINCASVPGGDVNKKTISSAVEEGIEFLFTSDPRTRIWQEGQMKCIGRFCIKKDFSLQRVKKISTLEGYRIDQVIWYSKKFLKVMFPSSYRRLIEARRKNGTTTD